LIKILKLIIKQKLKETREKMFTQEEFAYKLGMEASNYNRRENGVTKISKSEWDKMAKLLKVKLEEIYEPEDGIYVINGDYAHGNFGNGGIFNGNSEFVFETMKKYICKLEQENETLKQENLILKEQTKNT
jgi:transcriptional regulator with XRE-family HTH domain